MANEVQQFYLDKGVHTNDFVYRYIDEERYGGMPTQTLRGLMHDADFVIATMAAAIESMHRSREYQALYTSFLLDEITEEEFEADSASFVYQPADLTNSELRKRASVLFQYTCIDYSPGELAEVLECNLEQVNKIWDGLERIGQEE